MSVQPAIPRVTSGNTEVNRGAGPSSAPSPGAAWPGLIRALGARREVVAWLLTVAAALIVGGRVVSEFAYPVNLGLRYNAIGGTGLAGVETLALLVAAAALVIAVEATARSRLVVLVDLLVIAVAGVAAVVGLGLTLAAYGLSGISGLVTGSVLVQLGNLGALVVTGVVLRHALTLTPRPVRTPAPARAPKPRAPKAGGATAWPGRQPGYGPPPGYGPQPYRPAADRGPLTAYGPFRPPFPPPGAYTRPTQFGPPRQQYGIPDRGPNEVAPPGPARPDDRPGPPVGPQPPLPPPASGSGWVGTRSNGEPGGLAGLGLVGERPVPADQRQQ